MTVCTARVFLLTVCSMQLVVVIECQVFDFLGFMYGPILANFFHILLVILGFFGTLQGRLKYIIVYTLWNVIWIAWTLFVICFYLDVGSLNKDSDILNLGTGSRSWWEINGIGCQADFTTPFNNTTFSTELDPDPSRPPRPTKVEGCFMPYHQVEVIHAAVQCLLSVFGIMGGLINIRIYIDDDEGSLKGKKDQRPTAYTIEYNYQSNRNDPFKQQTVNGYGPHQVSPRPMTPRRVKRRSVLARDTINRASLHRRQGSSRSRSSQRRRPHQNPVTRLLEQQSRFVDSSMEGSVDSEIPTRPPSRYRSGNTGYTNPVFQPGSNTDINQIDMQEIYRPVSARSSYSNYHASRPISYIHNNEYFSNQAVAQVPINTNRNKVIPEPLASSSPNENNNVNTGTLKSFSAKTFLGFGIKSVNSINSNNINNNDSGVRNSKRVRADLMRNSTNRGDNNFFSQGPPAYREGVVDRVDSETVI